MFKLKRQLFYISNKSQADLPSNATQLDCHIFFFSEITGLFELKFYMGYLLDCFRSLEQNGRHTPCIVNILNMVQQ